MHRQLSPRPFLTNLPSQLHSQWQYGSGLDLAHKRWTSSGRAAIALALTDARIAKGANILVPAYYCPSMIDPIHFLGLTPSYYGLTESLNPDIATLKEKIDKDTQAILITRYFGFGHTSDELRDFCQENQLTVIEDRAHAFFGVPDKSSDYVAYSLPKFIPVFEGGLLASQNRDLNATELSTPSIMFQIKAMLWMFEYASQFETNTWYQKMGAFTSSQRSRLSAGSRTANKPSKTIGPASASGGSGLESEWVRKSATMASRLVSQIRNQSAITLRRRGNFEHLINGLSDVPGVRAIHPVLPSDVTPYAAAFEFQQAAKSHEFLKQEGVPLYRWDTHCLPSEALSLARTASYSKNILQFPTHQALTKANVSWLIKKIIESTSSK